MSIALPSSLPNSGPNIVQIFYWNVTFNYALPMLVEYTSITFFTSSMNAMQTLYINTTIEYVIGVGGSGV